MRLGKIVDLVAVIFVIIFAIFWIIPKIITKDSSKELVSPLGKQITFTERIVKTFTPKPKLAKLIEEELDGKVGLYSVAVKNLKTGESFLINENQQFTAASLYKLWVMAVAFEGINKGTLKESDSVSLSRGEVEEIQGYWQDGVKKDTYYSVSEAIENMITVSDNDSAITLYTHIGADRISEFLYRHGFVKSTFEFPPRTTAKDIADYFESLYKGGIANRTYSEKMLEILFEQKLNDRIPKYLPENVKVAHKTGELDTFKHDAGIINTPNGDYILVVLTDTPDPEAAAENIAVLSKKMYDYFEKENISN